jgi:hypothetical protein
MVTVANTFKIVVAAEASERSRTMEEGMPIRNLPYCVECFFQKSMSRYQGSQQLPYQGVPGE